MRTFTERAGALGNRRHDYDLADTIVELAVSEGPGKRQAVTLWQAVTLHDNKVSLEY